MLMFTNTTHVMQSFLTLLFWAYITGKMRGEITPSTYIFYLLSYIMGIKQRNMYNLTSYLHVWLWGYT